LATARYGDRLDRQRLPAALELGQERSSTLARLLEQSDFLFVDEADFEIEPSAWDRLVGTDRIDEVLAAVERYLEQLRDGEPVDLLPVLDDLGVNRRKTMPAVYAAIEGRPAGLPLFDSIRVLGREVALARVRRARERLGH